MQKFQHIINDEFVALADKLPPDIQRSIAKQFQFLRTNPLYPSLRFKKVSGRWALRITKDYRALGYEQDDDTITWYWVGPHDEYEKKIK